VFTENLQVDNGAGDSEVEITSSTGNSKLTLTDQGKGEYAIILKDGKKKLLIKDVSKGKIRLELTKKGDFRVKQGMSVDGNTLVVDSSNNRVGMGTTNPGRLLTVIDGTPNTAQLRLGQTDSRFWDLWGGFDLHFQKNGITRMFLKDNGNVGIGTTSPDKTLDVRGTIMSQAAPNTNSDNLEIKRPGALGPNNVRFVLSERSNNNNLVLYGHDGTTFKSFVKFDYPNDKTHIPSSGSTLTIDNANEKVGIGTTTPSTSLHVVGDFTLQSNIICTDCIDSADILDGTIQFSDIGQNGCASNQIMKWNGASWVCASDVTGTPYSIFAGEFVPGDETISWSSDHGGSNDRYMSACGIAVCNLVAPVHLPHGSTVTGLTCKVRDNDSTKTLTVRLLEHRGQLTTFGPGCQVSTTQDSNQIQSISSACSVTTDNVQNSYVLDFIHGSSGQLCTGGGSNCKIFRCSISYTPP